MFTHEPLQEARGSEYLGFWTEVSGCPLQRERQMALPAVGGLSPVHLRTPGAMQ